jgi:hypothetical protein
MSILEIIFNKTHYHKVPPCPRCGSKKTGRFLYVSSIQGGTEKIVSNCMARGELVSIMPGLDATKYENAYCEDCGIEWHANIETLWLNQEQILKERCDRGITKERYKNVKEIKMTAKQKLKEERKKRKAELKANKKKKRLQ